MRPYDFIIHKPDYYTFITSCGSEYHCYFFSFATAFSDYPDLANKVFGFNLELKYQPQSIIALNKRIAETVIIILKNFLGKKANAVVYICDNSDGREKARFHKFTNWFRTYDDGNIIQLKGISRAGNSNILNAILIHKNNPNINRFIEAYEILTGIYTKPDDDELQDILNDDGW